MNKDSKRTCKAIALLLKPFVLWRSRCCRRRSLPKLPIITCTSSRWKSGWRLSVGSSEERDLHVYTSLGRRHKETNSEPLWRIHSPAPIIFTWSGGTKEWRRSKILHTECRLKTNGSFKSNHINKSQWPNIPSRVLLIWDKLFACALKVPLWSKSRYPFFYDFVHNRSFLVILPNFKLLRTLQRAIFGPLFPRI